MIELNEVATYTPNMEQDGTGRFAVSVAIQRVMLTAFLKAASQDIARRKAQKELTGIEVPNNFPKVVVTYNTVGKGRKRIQGEDYKGKTGMSTFTHVGRPFVARRNKKGRVFFGVIDENRDGQFTALRLEGIVTFGFDDAAAQAAAVAQARTVAA